MAYESYYDSSDMTLKSRWVSDSTGVSVPDNSEYTFTYANANQMPTYQTPYSPSLPYIPSPKEVEITAIRARMTAIGLPDISINGHQIAQMIQDYARECVDKLRAETAAKFVQYDQTISKYREAMIMINPQATDPISGRKFREPGE